MAPIFPDELPPRHPPRLPPPALAERADPARLRGGRDPAAARHVQRRGRDAQPLDHQRASRHQRRRGHAVHAGDRAPGRVARAHRPPLPDPAPADAAAGVQAEPQRARHDARRPRGPARRSRSRRRHRPHAHELRVDRARPDIAARTRQQRSAPAVHAARERRGPALDTREQADRPRARACCATKPSRRADASCGRPQHSCP